MAKIIIQFSGKYADQWAKDSIEDVMQLFMRRDPLEEPHIYIEHEDNKQDKKIEG